MNTKQEIIEKINKIKALADNGVGGEMINAKALVEEMMESYNITEAELDLETELHLTYFRYGSRYPMSRKLIIQTIYSVIGDGREIYKKYKSNQMGVFCTKAEAIEIASKFGFYKSLLRKEVEYFMLAFVNKHHIFPPTDKLMPLTDKDKQKASELNLEKLNSMMKGMDEAYYRKQIGG